MVSSNKRGNDGTWEKVLTVDNIAPTSSSTSPIKKPLSPKVEPMGETISLQSLLQDGTGKPKSARSGALSVIDPDASISKQTIQGLRYLYKTGRISKEDKDDLIANMIDCVANDQEAIVETAFQVIYADRLANNFFDTAASHAALQDFADQCHIAIQKLTAHKEE
jgi:hypothetical protein